ncbi:MAG: SPFH domain-containing protein [Lachnospiraceae bacterium]|nr:SPFH domain-containing protein [uncultured Acetatifactor sp.]MCI8287702.1 SPFH domain-containing protein [Lachnospiraceae bacterium]
MGLIRAAKDAIGSLLADQWREYFYCDSLSNDILMTKGKRRENGGRGNNKGTDNIISDGSIVAVNEGQCMIIVEQGGIVEFSAEAGEFVFDKSTEPSLFSGDLGDSIMNTFKAVGKRFAFGGSAGKDQRVYFFNTKEIMNNLYGTATPVPFRYIDDNIGLDMDVSIRCNGSYSFRITDPLLFYQNVCGNVTDSYNRSQLQNQMKAELMTAMQPALGRISRLRVRVSDIPYHVTELVDAVNQELSGKWEKTRGIVVVSMTMNPPSMPEDVTKKISELQTTATLRNPNMAAATLAGAQAEAMKAAASNTSTGPMMAFAGMNMANAAGGMDASSLFAMGAAQSQVNRSQAGNGMVQTGNQSTAAPMPGWNCQCGHRDNRGKFCMECGRPKPSDAGWTCGCGTVNQGKFCTNCGSRRPEGAPLYKCDKCGWEPEDPAHPPKFCPECGDVFDERDNVRR